MAINQYQAPPQHMSGSAKIGWLREALSEANAFIEQQPGYGEIEKDTRIISDNEVLPGVTPKIRVNRAKVQVLDVAAALTDMRPLWEYANNNKQFDAQGRILNKASKAWWYNTNVALKIYEVLQYSLVQRVGYLFPFWSPHFYGPNIGDIDLRVGGPDSVKPLWIGQDYDLQKAYAVIIPEVHSLPEARAMYPGFDIKPDNENATWYRRGIQAALKIVSTLFTGEKTKPVGTCPTATVYHMYVRDMTLNTTGGNIPMGEPLTSWFYQVPSMGTQMPSGVFDNQGNELSRAVKDEDALLYPNRRLISFTENFVLYDGPSRHFHGKAPVVKFCLDPWPWDYFGGSMAHDQASIDKHQNEIRQGVKDHVDLTLDPPKLADRDAMGKTEVEKQGISMRTPGRTIDVSFAFGDPPFKMLPPEQLPNNLLEYLDSVDKLSDDISGRFDFRALAEKRQVPGGDTMEKIMQMVGPRTKLKSRLMQRSMADLAYQVKGLIFQWYDSSRRHVLLGDDGITKEDFDFDPNSLVPDGWDVEGMPAVNSRSVLYKYRYQRARQFQHFFQWYIADGNLHDQTSMTNQLLMFKLWQDPAFPKNPWRLAEALNIPNFGRPPETSTGSWIEESAVYMEQWSKLQAAIQAQAQMIMQGASPEGQIVGALKDALGGGPEGRPASFTAPPKLETRPDGNGGERSTITTSK